MVSFNKAVVAALCAFGLLICGPARAHAEQQSREPQTTPPRLTRCTIPPYIRNVGRVTIAAVADVDGRLRDPVVVSSTNTRLNRMFQDTIRTYWRCTPAALNGKPVRTVLTSTILVRRRTPVKVWQES